MKSAAGRDTREKPKDRKPSVEETGRKHALFYEKKLSLETQKALSSPDLSVDVFLAWWKGTNLTKESLLLRLSRLLRLLVSSANLKRRGCRTNRNSYVRV